MWFILFLVVATLLVMHFLDKSKTVKKIVVSKPVGDISAGETIGDAVFKFVTINQKYSIALIYEMAFRADMQKPMKHQQRKLADYHTNEINVKFDTAQTYFEMFGFSVGNLTHLTDLEKEILICNAHDILCINGKPTIKELECILAVFEELGVNPQYFIDTVNKYDVLTKHFS